MDVKEIKSTLLEECNLSADGLLVLGISGGSDSLSLLDLVSKSEIPLIAAHLDHALRPSSAAESAVVERFCLERRISFVSERVDVSRYAQENRISIEEAARIMRYQFLFRVANQKKAQAVLVAHHADDQVETILMHFLRGAGLSGLSGMPKSLLPNSWSDEIPLVRPFLSIWRSEINEYCAELKLTPVVDESNADKKYFRNQLRLELIPELESISPGIKDRLHKMSLLMAGDNDYLEREAEKAMFCVTNQQTKDFIVLNQPFFQKLHNSMQRRVLRKSIFMLNATLRDVDYDAIERARTFFQPSNRKQALQLPSGIEMLRNLKEQVVLYRGSSALEGLWPQLSIVNGTTLPEKGTLNLSDQWLLKVEVEKPIAPPQDPYNAILDYEKTTGQLSVRTFKPGDRFAPFGMGGETMKLGDFWTNSGLAQKARKMWPLVCDEKQIVWVPGFRIADTVAVTKTTIKVLHMEITQLSR